jgi:polyhydroxyalkanoate synthesis regulator phasin
VSNKVSEKAEAKSDEVEIMINDLEASQQRAAIAEREVEALRDQIRIIQDSANRYFRYERF